MRAVSLFSGAGGMDVGFASAGIHAIQGCEMNADAAATYRANVGGAMHEGDVRDLIPRLERGMADAVFGGPPCQGYSIAGKMNPSDPRSALVNSFLDAVERVSPGVFVMENVDALATLAKWSGTLADIRGRASAMGYATHVRVLNAADFGVPQSRRRMFMWGAAGVDEATMAAVASETLSSRTQPLVTARAVFGRLGPAGTESNPATCPARITFARNPVMRSSPYAGMLFNGAGRPINPDAPAPTIAASSGGNKTHFVDEGHVFRGEEPFVVGYHAAIRAGGQASTGLAPSVLRRITVAESRAFQTFPDGFTFSGGKSSQYRQIGNAVPCLLAEAVGAAAVAIAGCRRRAAA